MERCFGSHSPLYSSYHDDEWGIPSHSDNYLFEMLILEGAQAGLSWETILNKREGYRDSFHQFDPERVAQMSDSELEKLRKNPAIVRNRLKIASARQNARVFLAIQKEFGSFDRYLWGFVDGKPIVNRWQEWKQVPCQTELSDEISKDLKRRGMNFVGSKIIYAYMQAVGLVDDHLESCWKGRGDSGR